MFKLSLRKRRGTQGCDEQDWQHDPLGHPALLAMSPRELADLPMVAEVPMRVGKVELAARSGQGVNQELPRGCAASR